MEDGWFVENIWFTYDGLVDGARLNSEETGLI
jgi:hypothetical protein